MKDTITKLTQMDDWVFEVKMIRALKVRKHGEPYDAVANLTANGENIYVDTLLTKDGEEFSKKDFLTICKFCQSMGMKELNYDRIKNGVRRPQRVPLNRKHRPARLDQKQTQSEALEQRQLQQPRLRLVR